MYGDEWEKSKLELSSLEWGLIVIEIIISILVFI